MVCTKMNILEGVKMRCFRSVNTERRDEYNRIILKGALVSFIALCVLFLGHNFLVSSNFETTYNLVSFLGIILIYPIHKMLHVIALFRYHSGLQVGIKKHFYLLPCLHVRIKQMVPRKRYIFSLLFPFLFILFIFFGIALLVPIWNSPVFLILLSIHIGMCCPDFIHVNRIRKCPKNCYVEDGKRGFSILIAE